MAAAAAARRGMPAYTVAIPRSRLVPSPARPSAPSGWSPAVVPVASETTRPRLQWGPAGL